MSSTATPVADRVFSLVADMATHAPPEILAAFAAEQQQLDQAGVPAPHSRRKPVARRRAARRARPAHHAHRRT
jgi:hypothetical protein